MISMHASKLTVAAVLGAMMHAGDREVSWRNR
jgi:hypothetical protein